jgi:hypothetical protein
MPKVQSVQYSRFTVTDKVFGVATLEERRPRVLPGRVEEIAERSPCGVRW